MFIQHLNDEQQAALYHFSKELIAADGYVDERETLLLDGIIAQCNNSADLEQKFDIKQIPEIFSEKAQKMAFLIELVGVAYADQVIEENEDNLIKNVAEALSVELSLIDELKDWVQRQMTLVFEAEKFLEK
ncbi:TerB family tellurite resistance protein [Vibrio sp. S/42/10]|uniref:DNA repair protein n=1 Tax=Vibrio cyclitrophicus TaxID=47951 RepID=A0A7Z1S1F2_9VIBR|nr:MULTISPECIES: TerB family tellurite resistance protein [Vibrio]MDH5880476.1 TerB family tellurite resistance protein [Vibrio sp. S/42/10]PMP23036.1 DNA repair protein [Vibrio cyclitrophicus]PMP29548.1 DNA repair protein [Vibrio cyclitrophicus]